MKKKKISVTDQHINALSLALQKRRIALGLSQDELADKAGLHRTYVSLIERKSCNFSIKIYMRLAFALDVDPAELMRQAAELAAIGSKSKHDRNPYRVAV
jgi:transcriptional regulator with XRE-family HTH domain